MSCVARSWATTVGSSRSSSERAEMLTAMRKFSPRPRQTAHWRSAVSSTQCVSGPSRPSPLGKRQKAQRRDQAVARVRPAQQRLDAGHLPQTQVYQRLVVQEEATAGKGVAKLLRQRQMVGTVRVERNIVECISAARVLGGIHCHIGVGQQGGRVAPVLWEEGDADASRHVGTIALQLSRSGQCPTDPPDHHQGGLPISAGEKNGEFVATQTCHSVRGAQHLLHPACHRLEQPIPHLMAQGVVHLFEAVQVQQAEGQRGCGALGSLERRIQPVVEQGTIGQAGQAVVQRLMLQGRLGHLAL